MPDTVFVTGATGFIGSHLVDALLSQGSVVRCLVERSDEVDSMAEKGVEVVCGDLVDRELLATALQGIDVVYHLAAVLSSSRKPEEEFMRVNDTGTQYLCEAALQEGIRKFVHFSSIGVSGFRREPVLLDEGSPCEPASPYERSKEKAERTVLKYYSERQLPAVLLRPSRVYGEHDLSEMLTLFKRIKEGRFRFIGSMRKNKWSLCYVKDLVEAAIAAEKTEACVGKVFFISGERPYTLEELVRTAAAELNVKVPRADVPEWMAKAGMSCYLTLRKMQGRSPDISAVTFDRMLGGHQICDTARARKAFNFSPKYSLEEGMRCAIHWYKESGFL